MFDENGVEIDCDQPSCQFWVGFGQCVLGLKPYKYKQCQRFDDHNKHNDFDRLQLDLRVLE